MLQNRLSEKMAPEPDLLSLRQSLSTLRGLVDRQRPVLLLVVFACVALALIYILTSPKGYTATAELFLDSHKSQSLQQQSPMGTDVPVDSSMVDSQVEILKSESIALSVIKDLQLADDPEFTGPSGYPLDTIIRTVGSVFSSGDDTPTANGRLRTVLSRFQDNLTVKRLLQSYVIELSYQSRSPDRSAQIANAVAEAFIVDSLEAKYQSSRRAAGWLQDRLKELRAQASNAERAVADYKAKNNIVDSGGRLLTEQQLAEVNSTLTIARTQRAEAEARLERITQILRNDNADTSALFNNLATVADTLRNEVITRLRQQYLDLAAREADWSNRYGQNHLAVVNLRNQMREIRKSITDELRRIAETYKSDVEIAKAREDSAQKALNDTIATSNDTSQAQIVLRDLESNAQSARALADNFLQLYMMSVQQQSFPITDARVITQAMPPLRPSSPKSLLILLAAVVGGSILALLVGLFRDLTDGVFRTNRQIEDSLGVSCLASVPYVRTTTAVASGRPRAWLGRILNSVPYSLRSPVPKPTGVFEVNRAGSTIPFPRSTASTPGRIMPVRQDVGAMMVNAPFSSFAESIRSIKMAIDLATFSTEDKVTGVTSSLPNEGKSTISFSVASAMAQSRIRTLLVDGDIRNPSLTKRLTPDAKAGLINMVLDDASLDECIWTDTATDLHFLPCVLPHRFSNSGDILSSSMMENVFSKLRQNYDRVVLDLSPLAPVVDVRATTKLVDNYILVIAWADTSAEVVDRALAEAEIVRQRLLGAVLNKVDVATMHRYDASRGGYYQNKYYKAYGYVEH
jgi:succinoglycan biosynthesis transport protein ExoP